MNRNPYIAPDGRVYSPEEMDAWNVEQEAQRKRAFKMKWHRLADLPGFEEWSAQYRWLAKIIPDYRQHRVLIHPDEFGKPFDERFALVFQGRLEDNRDLATAHGIPQLFPKRLEQYKRSQGSLLTVCFRGGWDCSKNCGIRKIPLAALKNPSRLLAP